MARPLIVEPGTERLQVVLMRGCATVDATEVTLTVTRKGEVNCMSTPPCPDTCTRPWPRAHDVPEGRWGGCHSWDESNCSACSKVAPTWACLPRCDGIPPAMHLSPSKTYRAESVIRGVATFLIDQDLIEAPEGWYLGQVSIAGCEVAVLTLWVVRGKANVRAGPT